MNKILHIVAYCDTSYLRHTLTMLRSAAENLGAGANLQAWILHSGIDSEAQHSAEQILRTDKIQLCWLHIRPSDFGFQSYKHVSAESLLRLVAGSVLPPDIDRVLILDSDLIVRADLNELWNLDMHGFTILAAQDHSHPFVGLSASPILHHFRLEPDTAYFNAGVLLIDLKKWRSEGVEKRLFELYRKFGHLALWGDQCLLNVALSGQWGILPPYWNAQTNFSSFAYWRTSPFSRNEFRTTRDNPKIVHFTGEDKPWHNYCHHPFQSDYFKYADHCSEGEIRRRAAWFLTRSRCRWISDLLWLVVQRKRAARLAGLAPALGKSALASLYLRNLRIFPLATILVPILMIKLYLKGFLSFEPVRNSNHV